MGLGQYDSLGEYCGPHTASSEFLILVWPYTPMHPGRGNTVLYSLCPGKRLAYNLKWEAHVIV